METRTTTDLGMNPDVPLEMVGNLHETEAIAGLKTIIAPTMNKKNRFIYSHNNKHKRKIV